MSHMYYIQIFVYNTGIKNNYPMIGFSTQEELIDFVECLYLDIMENGIFPKEQIFTINNPHLLPDDVKLVHNHKSVYYSVKKNLDLLKENIPQMFNGAEEFIKFL